MFRNLLKLSRLWALTELADELKFCMPVEVWWCAVDDADFLAEEVLGFLLRFLRWGIMHCSPS